MEATLTVAQGFSESLLMGFESSYGVLPGSPTADKLPVVSPQLKPSVNRFTSKALTGVSRARATADGKIGLDGSFGFECSRESLNFPLKALFGTPTDTGVTGWYDHYFTLGTQPSFYLEQRHSDINAFILNLGCLMSSWQANVQAEGLMESTFMPMGLNEVAYSSEQITSTITDRTGSTPFNYVTATLKEGGSAIAYGTSVQFTIDRHLKPLLAIDGTTSRYAIIQGDLPTIKVNFTAFFTDLTLLNKALLSTETSLEILIPAVESGHGVKIIFPTGKYLPTGPTTQGQGEVTLQLDSDFYARGTSSFYPGEALGKYITSVTVGAGTTDSLKVKVDGAAATTVTLTSGSRTLAQLVTQINAGLTGAACVAENGRLRIYSSNATGGSIQIDATGTAQTLLGFDTSLHSAYSNVDVLVRVSNADATI